MVHVEAPRPPDPNIPVFFNVDSAVGRMAPNSLEDVLLVQFLLKSLATHMTTEKGRKIQPILAATPQSGRCDDATIKSIEAFQRAMGSIVDGRISPARGYTYGSGIFSIVNLNSTVRNDYPKVWPRLDQMPNCPGGLKSVLPRIL